MFMKVFITWETLPTKRTGIAVIQAAVQTFITEALEKRRREETVFF
jgi:hypothetical protein